MEATYAQTAGFHKTSKRGKSEVLIKNLRPEF